MGINAWVGLGELFVPPSSGPGVRFVDMPATLLALNAALFVLPVAAVVFILTAVSGMRFIPGVDTNLVWRVGGHTVGALKVAAFVLVGFVALFVALLAIALLEFSDGGINLAVGLAGHIVGSAIPVGLGWYLMLISGLSLSPLAKGIEKILLILSVIWAGAFAVLLIAAGAFATFALGSSALQSGVVIPPRVPWADAASAMAGFAALIVLAVIARRVSVRYQSGQLVGSAHPA